MWLKSKSLQRSTLGRGISDQIFPRTYLTVGHQFRLPPCAGEGSPIWSHDAQRLDPPRASRTLPPPSGTRRCHVSRVQLSVREEACPRRASPRACFVTPEVRPAAAEVSGRGLPTPPTSPASVAQRGDATKGRGQARARKSRGRECYVYPASSWRFGLLLGCVLWGRVEAARCLRRNPLGRESGSRGEGRSLGRRGWSGRREGRGGGLRRRGWGGEVTRRRFCGAAGLVLGGNGLTQPGLLGSLPVSGFQVGPAFRSGVLPLLCRLTVFLSVLCALVYEMVSHPLSGMSLTALGEAGGRLWLSLFYRLGNWGSLRHSELVKAPQITSVNVGTSSPGS